jgi:hypothetical protein
MDRTSEIQKLRKIGWSWSSIGVHFSISKSRAHQIGSGYKYENFPHYIIFERDGYKCQFPNCDGVGRKLVVHHLDHNDRNNKAVNLITVCVRCHTINHRYKPRFCVFCNKEHLNKSKYCSVNCKKLFWVKKRTRKCLWCKKDFIPKCKRTKCCGTSCRSKQFWKVKHDKIVA